MKRRGLLIIVALIAIGAGICWQLPNRDALVQEILARLNSASSEAAACPAASGSIQAEEVLVSTEVAGRIQQIAVDAGDSVSAGQVLAQLDVAMLDARIASAQAAVRVAETELEQVRAGASQEEIAIVAAAVSKADEDLLLAEKGVDLAEASVEAAVSALEAARAELARVSGAVRPQDLALAEAQLELAQGQLRGAHSVRDSVGGGVSRGEIPAATYDVAQAVVSEAEIGIRMADLQLQELKAGPHPDDVRAAQATVDAAQAQVDAAQAEAAKVRELVAAARSRRREAQAQLDLAQAGPSVEQIALAQAQVNGAEAALKILKIQRAKTTLLAPRDGVVLDRSVVSGERVLPGSALFRLADLDRMTLVVYVSELEIAEIDLDQAVDVRVDSFPTRVFGGHVVHIASQAEFTPSSVQTYDQRAARVFAVRIELPNPDHALKPGMPADSVFSCDRIGQAHEGE